jgi:hypothetical protein
MPWWLVFIVTDVSKYLDRVGDDENKGITIRRNVGRCLVADTSQYPRKFASIQHRCEHLKFPHCPLTVPEKV